MPSSGRWVVLFTERVSPPRRRVPFCTGRKEPKSRQGVGAIGRNGVAAPASMPPTPWTPITGVNPWAGQEISGAQNLSGWSKFPPGHWALGLQKLPLLRFHNCAWLGRTNALGPFSAVGAAHPGRPRLPEPNLSSNTPKGALSTRRSGTERLPNPQRQRE